MRKYFAHACLALMAMAPQAAWAQDTWASQRKIAYIYPSAGGFTFMLDGDRVNPTSACEANRMILPLDAPNYQAIVSAIVTAFSSRLVVDVAYDASTTSACETVINRLVVHAQN
jgi:hypothetical protein